MEYLKDFIFDAFLPWLVALWLAVVIVAVALGVPLGIAYLIWRLID